MTLVQIGSGSANDDKFYKDGFTNFVIKNKKQKIIIIEANSIHLKKLNKFWKFKKQVKIFNIAIIPDNISLKKMTFFYSVKDKPNYQLFSSSKSFVKKHFPNEKIKKKIVICSSISNFLKSQAIDKIDYLALDIEGMDYDVLINFDLNKFKIKNISFEHLHLNFWEKIKIVLKLIRCGYFFSGMGFDLRKSDWMFTKNYQLKRLRTFLLPITPRRVWKKYSFSDQI